MLYLVFGSKVDSMQFILLKRDFLVESTVQMFEFLLKGLVVKQLFKKNVTLIIPISNTRIIGIAVVDYE